MFSFFDFISPLKMSRDLHLILPACFVNIIADSEPLKVMVDLKYRVFFKCGYSVLSTSLQTLLG